MRGSNMKRKIFAGLAGLSLIGAAVAATLTATWTAPTTNTDGSPITAPLTYNVYSGASGAEVRTQSGLTVTTQALTAAAGVKQCVQVTAVANDLESARTPEVCATPSFSVPNAPTGLTLQ